MKNTTTSTFPDAARLALWQIPAYVFVVFLILLFALLFAVPLRWTAPSFVFLALYVFSGLSAFCAFCERFFEGSAYFDRLFTMVVLGFAGCAVYWVIIMPAANFLPGQAQRLRSQLGEVKEVKTSVLPELDAKHAPLVTYRAAYLAATQALSQIPALGSRFEVGRLQKQRVGNALEWVGFLEPKGLLTWAYSHGTPGYVRVSASDASDVKLVTSLGGAPLLLRYTEAAPFQYKLERSLFLRDSSARYEDMSPEIDDSGRPFYVVSRFENDIGFFNHKVVGITIVDPQTGDATDYDLKHIPAWVDRVFPEEEVVEQVDNWGELVLGRFNFSGRDKLTPSSSDLVYSADGKAYFAVGLSANGSDSGVQGFLFVDTRTKEVFRLNATGISEKQAQDAAENVFSAQKYKAGNAIPFLINGEPTYVMPMVLSDQIVAYAMVSLSSYERVATGKTPMEAYRAFSSLTGSAGLAANGAVTSKALTGVVERIAQNARSGLFSLKLQHVAGIFIASPDLSDQVVLTRPGDSVRLTVSVGTASQIVQSFKNNSFEHQ